MTSDRLTSMMGGMVPYPRDSSRPSSVFSKEVGMSVDDEDEYDGSEADGMEPDGDGPIRSCRCWRTMGTGSAVPRGVASAWWVSFRATRLSIPELDWLMRVRDGAGRSVRVPEHRYSRSDRDAVESARGRCIRWCRSRSARRRACTRRGSVTRKACSRWVPRARWT